MLAVSADFYQFYCINVKCVIINYIKIMTSAVNKFNWIITLHKGKF